MLKQRTLTALVLAPIAIAMILFLPTGAFALVTAAISLQALWEWARLAGVALIGIDTAVPSAPFLASGRVGDPQRDRLARILNETADAGCFRVVLLHHSPLFDGHAPRNRLTDARDVTDVLMKHGAELVIHGHGHEERVDRLHGPFGPMLVVAVPSASYSVPGRAGWNQYRVSGDAGCWRLEMTTRRTAANGFATTSTETVSWDSPVSRAAAPRSR